VRATLVTSLVLGGLPAAFGVALRHVVRWPIAARATLGLGGLLVGFLSWTVWSGAPNDVTSDLRVTRSAAAGATGHAPGVAVGLLVAAAAVLVWVGTRPSRAGVERPPD